MSHSKKHMLSFYLTTKCNLDCIYCFTNKSRHANQTLDIEFAKHAIDEYVSEDNIKHIRFSGAGEPTEEFELMKEITKYSRSKLKEVKTEIQTNGAFDENIRDWISDNLDITWISMDGPPDLQDYFRPLRESRKGPSRIIEDNIRFISRYGKGMIGVRSTIINKNMTKQVENIDYFSDLGIRYIWSDPIFPSVGDNLSYYEDLDLMLYAEEFVNAKKYANSKGIFYESILTCNFDEKTKINCRACIPLPHLTTDGYISACDMALYGGDENHMSVFIYGKWDRDRKIIMYDQEKINILKSRNIDNLKECRSCEAKHHCAGYCLGEVQNEERNLFKRKAKVCNPIRFLFKELDVDFGTYKYFHP